MPYTSGIYKPTVLFVEEAEEMLQQTEAGPEIVGRGSPLRQFVDGFVRHTYLQSVRDDLKSKIKVQIVVL